MADPTDPLGALNDAHAAAERAVEAARAALAAQPLADQVAGFQEDLAAAAPVLQRLKVRASAMPDTFGAKPTALQWTTSGLALPDFVTQMATLAAATALIAPKG